ncbi:hypothetical protein PHMEG_00018832 [Phytophthora megakarya]|uniref:Uncharacterized protein n=1 Tax=Phytophthora megakarya TaxID=4795 RepID=A0A225VUV7_9STRA|nr:hypothetical protein PHMEG_00018832 [Phytophthora megakarya]
MSRKVKPPVCSVQYVDLGPWGFALWWFIILAVHLAMFGYNTAYAMFYYYLQKTYMYLTFEYYSIGMVAKYHHTIANVNAVMAALHGGCILLMICGSTWQRALVFAPLSQENDSIPKLGRRRSSADAYDMNVLNNKTPPKAWPPKFRTVRMYSKVWGRQGVLGVNGVNFHAILIARELVETAFQTQQAYRMSWYLPRWLLNRFYVCLLVLNCWSSIIVHALFKKNEAHRRFACLLCDCVLDLISCMGVPLIVVLGYVGQYDVEMTGFDMERWYDEEWTAHALNEFQIVLVTSWTDLISRTVFSFGLIATTTSLKELLRHAPVGNKRIACVADDIQLDKPKRIKSNNNVTLNRTQKSLKIGKYSRHMMLNVMHLFFAAWGLMVLSLHIHASLQPQLPQCTLQVHPWALTKPACYLTVLDCYQLSMSGNKSEVEEKWSEFDRSSVVMLVMRHCIALEVPDMISDFRLISGIKVYNSTINDWGASAAITSTNHPDVGFLFLVRVNMTDGLLPEGLYNGDFPKKLYDIEICYTNLHELPGDLDSIWNGELIYIEYSQLTSVPLSLINLNPTYLALTGNPIVELPPEIFEIPNILFLGVGSTLINELPRNVTNLSSLLGRIYVTDTNISYFWPWIDPFMVEKIFLSRVLFVGGSTYCAELEKINNGEADSFSVQPSSEYSPILTNSSEENREVILQTVNCDIYYAATFYPIDFEDANSALS